MRTVLNEAFDELVAAVGTRLKTRGFTQRGPVLRIVAQNNCGIVEFQKSVKSSEQALLFTINLGVICGDLLYSGSFGAEKAQMVDAHVRQRIGMLLPDHPDKWWKITESTNRDLLIQEVSELVAEKAAPFIESHLNTKTVIALWESGQSPGLTDLQRARFLARLTKVESSRRDGSTG